MVLFGRFMRSVGLKKKLDVKKRFELQRRAISGTMSKVYMAKDRQSGEVVALKILDPKKTKEFESRFKGLLKPTEGEIASQFRHPYIVETKDFGMTTTGEPYIVMEYLEGTGLNSVLLSRKDLLAGAQIHYMRQVAEALAEVHKLGFIHRDVCPRNLIFTGDGRILKLTDFGLSVPAKGGFLAPGNRTGTPNYMAPELVRRRATDQRLDVFSYGVTMYEMLTRELPWPRGTTGQAAMAHDTPPAEITAYRPQIHPRLSKAIHACIEPDVRKRCPSMNHFLRMIGALQSADAEGEMVS